MSVREYPPGYFTALIHKHDWPTRFAPDAHAAREANLTAKRKRAALAARAAAIDTGTGYGDGSIKGMGRNAARDRRKSDEDDHL